MSAAASTPGGTASRQAAIAWRDRLWGEADQLDRLRRDQRGRQHGIAGDVRQAIGVNVLRCKSADRAEAGRSARPAARLRAARRRVGQHGLDPDRVVGQMGLAAAAERRMDQEHVTVRRDQRFVGQSADLAAAFPARGLPTARGAAARAAPVRRSGWAARSRTAIPTPARLARDWKRPTRSLGAAADRFDHRRFDQLPPVGEVGRERNQMPPKPRRAADLAARISAANCRAG